MRNEEARFELDGLPQYDFPGSSHPILYDRFGVMPYVPKQASHL
jgi:hypothetical protein